MYLKVNIIIMKEEKKLDTSKNGAHTDVEKVCITHISVAKGISSFDEKVIQAVLSKFSQLDGKVVVELLSLDEINPQ